MGNDKTYPCVKCNIHAESGVKCNSCNKWVHYVCSELPIYSIITLMKTKRQYTCDNCVQEKISNYEEEEKEIQEIIGKEHQYKLEHEPIKSENQRIYPSLPTLTPSQDEKSPPRKPDLERSTYVNEGYRSSSESEAEEDEEENRVVSNKKKPLGYNKENEKRSIPICNFYKNGWCKYGKKCRYSHPKKCWKFLSGGYSKSGCKEKSCKYLHPNICKDSWKKKQCLNENCKQYHLKGTTRKSNNQSGKNKYDENLNGSQKKEMGFYLLNQLIELLQKH
jgi:hypothetical protein